MRMKLQGVLVSLFGTEGYRVVYIPLVSLPVDRQG